MKQENRGFVVDIGYRGNNNINGTTIGIYLTLICNFLILYGNAYQNKLLVSWGTRFLVLYVFLMGVIAALWHARQKTLSASGFFYLMLIISTIVGALATGWRTFSQHLVNYMCFLMVPAYFILFKDLKSIGRVRRHVCFAFFVYAGLFFWLSSGKLAYIGYNRWGTYYGNDMTLGYDNANEAAIYLLITFIGIFAVFFTVQQFLLKIAVIGIEAWLLYLIWQTHSRAAFLSALIVILFIISGLAKKIKTGWRNVIVALPAVFFPFVWAFPEFFSKLIVLGEASDSGRSGIYGQFLNDLTVTSFFFGDYGTKAGANLHSSYLSIFANFGIVAMTLYIVFLCTVLKEYCEEHEMDQVSYVAFAGILGLVIHGIAEGSVWISGTVYAGMLGMLILLMIPRGKTEQIELGERRKKE